MLAITCKNLNLISYITIIKKNSNISCSFWNNSKADNTRCESLVYTLLNFIT